MAEVLQDISETDERTARNDAVDSILRSLTGLRGVTAAAIVDGDGLVTHIRRDFDSDEDALGASVQIVFGVATRAAEHVGHTAVKIVISENKGGFIVMAPLESGLLLALFTDTDALLGSVRFEIKETIPTLNRLF